MMGTFTLCQGRWASRKTKKFTVPLRRHSKSKRSSCPGSGGIGGRTSPRGSVVVTRFAAHASFTQVNECVFRVLAMETEPIDPRL